MLISTNQRTLEKSVSFSGIGLHSGRKVHLTLKPAPPNHGIKFKRTDLPNMPVIPALFQMVVDTSLATVIGEEGAIVSTVEHLMASLTGMGVDNALVELDAHEVPVMDGSAKLFTSMIKKAGIVEQKSPRFCFLVKEPIEITDGDRFAAVYPSDTFKITCTIDFAHPIIGIQSFSVDVEPESFEKDIAPARTFCHFKEIEYMKQDGLALGGSLENAIVHDGEKVLNPDGLRFKDEFVRHKILDCIGDFSLLGMPFLGHMVVKKSGHMFNHLFLKEFFTRKKSWDTVLMSDAFPPEDPGKRDYSAVRSVAL
ncbi:MAG: UDP-3-O-acyl-N-acetylglucosamine deacetylase [Desulfobacteraceae bacterium]|nr:UDP-3-O-acyl-N-acetylglucosamine deacetylase [Desulfobacteraceae bacterium]MBU4001117.1 UDP-3-O-acyl-N-acetylglucosamine deacetylase [Pseudomonadota bacterium]